MRGREPIVPQRRRRIPPQFSWVDHRLVRDGHIQGRSAPALALYLFLVAVADAEGLSWYSEAVLCRYLSLSGPQLQRARAELERADLIAYRRPLYQVLDLAQGAVISNRHRGSKPYSAEVVSAGEILQRLLAPVCEVHAGGGGGR